MKVAIASDHRGYDMCQQLCEWLDQQEYEVVKLGPASNKPNDYPDPAVAVATAVSQMQCECGILVGGAGIGMSIVANKIRGIRAALVHDAIGADQSRRHNDANVLCLPSDMLGQRIVNQIVRTWLMTEFEGGRHERRLNKIAELEQTRPMPNPSQSTNSSPTVSE